MSLKAYDSVSIMSELIRRMESDKNSHYLLHKWNNIFVNIVYCDSGETHYEFLVRKVEKDESI